METAEEVKHHQLEEELAIDDYVMLKQSGVYDIKEVKPSMVIRGRKPTLDLK